MTTTKHHEIRILFQGTCPQGKELNPIDYEKEIKMRTSDLNQIGCNSYDSAKKDDAAARATGTIYYTPQLASSFSMPLNRGRAAHAAFRDGHKGPAHVSRYMELAAKNRFEEASALPELTNEEKATLRAAPTLSELAGGQFGPIYLADDEKLVNDMAGNRRKIFDFTHTDFQRRIDMRKKAGESADQARLKTLEDFSADCYGLAANNSPGVSGRKRSTAVEKALLEVYWTRH